MGPDLDAFDEIFPGAAAKTVASRKFQPKARSKKAPSVLKSAVQSFDKVENLVTGPSVNMLLDHSVAVETVEFNGSLNNSEILNASEDSPFEAPSVLKSSVQSFDKVGNVVTGPSVNMSLDHSVAEETVEFNASLNNSEILNASEDSPLEAPSVLKSFVQSFDKVENVVTGPCVNMLLDQSVAGETVEVNASLNNSEILDNEYTYFGFEHFKDSCSQPTTAADTDVKDSKEPSGTKFSGDQKLSEVDEAQDYSGADFEYADITMGEKEDDGVPGLEISDDMYVLPTSPELQTGRFEPKPKDPHSTGKSCAEDPFADRVESASYMQEPSSAVVSSDEFILDDFSYAFPENNDEFEPYTLDPPFELPGNNESLNEEPALPVEISQEDISFTAIDAPASKVAPEGDGTIGSEGADNNDQDRVSDKHKKKTPAKSKRSTSQKGKTGLKRTREDENPDQPTEKIPKRFPRSTRRPKRQVDKAILEIPEDELDLQQIPIRDIILLAEHKEKLEKEGKKSKKSQSTNASASNSIPQHMRGENASEQAGCNNEETDPPVEDGCVYTNYHSYMEKTPRARWSKQDTELFYQGVRQFGSDLSFIQQLFPGRTRNQIKLKYKKEERQNPMMLHDALTGRAKDNSQFEQLIKLLKTSMNDSADLASNEDLCGPEISGVETEKSEKVDKTEPEPEEGAEKVEEEKEEDEAEKGMEVEEDVAEIWKSPIKEKYGSEDVEEDIDWGDYVSEL